MTLSGTTSSPDRARLVRRRRTGERTRLLVVIAVGVAAVFATARIGAPWQLIALTGWLMSALTFVVWTVASVATLDATETRALATAEDDSRASTRLLLVIASVASLPGVALGLVAAHDAEAPLSVWLTAAALGTVVVSWLLVHVVFMLRYCDLFFDAPEGGIDFPHDDQPDYWDFGYLAFTVGMTFQVSDTDITSRAIRHTVLRHALLAYLFGAVIVAVTINIVGGMFH